MCGIGGIYTSLEASMPVGEVKALWEALEDRGTHAAGISYYWDDSDKPVVSKNAKPASQMSDVVTRFCAGTNTRYAFFHTRYTTQGSTSNNGNNHPVVSQGIILTHNGVLRNDNYVFRFTGLNRLHDVDTEALNAGLRFGDTQWIAENIQGSISIAWVDTTQNQQNVNLFTNGRNPLVVARVNGHQVVWASTLDHIEEAGFEIESHFNAEPYKQYTLSRDEEGQVLISSHYVSDRFAEPMISGMYRHTSSYARNVGYTTPQSKKGTKCVKSSKIGNSEAKAKKSGQKIVLNGMEYDPITQTWKNARW
jgi:asparagine synthetase B (glutamine-hydrolysing)